MQCKQVQETGRDGGHITVESLRTDDGTVHLTFDEAVPREADVTVCLDDLLQREHTVPVGAAGGVDIEPLPGQPWLVRRRRSYGRAPRSSPSGSRLPSADPGTYLEHGSVPDPRTPRDEALRSALIATHCLVGGEGVEFVSLIDPPADLAAHAGRCRNEFTFPVLGGGSPAPARSRGPQGAAPDT
ncbi:hypothetical protein ACFQV4_30505 [Streptomyces thermocarboxydus]